MPAKKALSRADSAPKGGNQPGGTFFPEYYRVVAADLSLKRPGFAILWLHNIDGATTILKKLTVSVDNKRYSKPHSQILEEIYSALYLIIGDKPYFANNAPGPEHIETWYVREKAFNSRGAMSEIGIFKVVGIADLILWQAAKKEWAELYPISVKKIITGCGKADKEQVASCLPHYVGDFEYANDDESDAMAVAIAFLIQQGQIKPYTVENKETKNASNSAIQSHPE